MTTGRSSEALRPRLAASLAIACIAVLLFAAPEAVAQGDVSGTAAMPRSPGSRLPLAVTPLDDDLHATVMYAYFGMMLAYGAYFGYRARALRQARPALRLFTGRREFGAAGVITLFTPPLLQVLLYVQSADYLGRTSQAFVLASWASVALLPVGMYASHRYHAMRIDRDVAHASLAAGDTRGGLTHVRHGASVLAGFLLAASVVVGMLAILLAGLVTVAKRRPEETKWEFEDRLRKVTLAAGVSAGLAAAFASLFERYAQGVVGNG